MAVSTTNNMSAPQGIRETHRAELGKMSNVDSARYDVVGEISCTGGILVNL